MTQTFTIAGVGEAVLAIDPQGTTMAGVAVEVAQLAIQLGHRGVAVSRVGQDEAADDLLRRCRAAGIEVDHLQTDPDLATGRRVTRRFGGQDRPARDEWAAYDNLQWDFDLEDLAQRLDGVVCGGLALRGGQTRSTVERLLDSCGGAARFLAMTAADDPEGHRGEVLQVLRLMDGACLDRASLSILCPSFHVDDALHDALPGVARTLGLAFVLLVDPDTITACADARVVAASREQSCASAAVITTAFVLSLLGGASIEACVQVGADAQLQDRAESGDHAPDAPES